MSAVFLYSRLIFAIDFNTFLCYNAIEGKDTKHSPQQKRNTLYFMPENHTKQSMAQLMHRCANDSGNNLHVIPCRAATSEKKPFRPRQQHTGAHNYTHSEQQLYQKFAENQLGHIDSPFQKSRLFYYYTPSSEICQ